MSKLFTVLILLFIVGFVVQQSNLFETKKAYDARLGVATDEYNVNWDNLFKYLGEIPIKIKKMFPAKKRPYKPDF